MNTQDEQRLLDEILHEVRLLRLIIQAQISATQTKEQRELYDRVLDNLLKSIEPPSE